MNDFELPETIAGPPSTPNILRAKENGQGILDASGVEPPKDPDAMNASDRKLAEYYGTETDGGI